MAEIIDLRQPLEDRLEAEVMKLDVRRDKVKEDLAQLSLFYSGQLPLFDDKMI